jgi:hypothetical protein
MELKKILKNKFIEKVQRGSTSLVPLLPRLKFNLSSGTFPPDGGNVLT